MNREERVTFCDACNAITSWYAEHCESCGAAINVGRANASEEDGEVKLFQAQMRLIHRTRESAEDLGRDLRALSRRVEELKGEALDRTSQERIRAASGRLMELEESWSEIQREYNRSSEIIEENFHESVAAGKLSIELNEKKAQALETEMKALIMRFEDLETEMREMGRLLDHLTARARSGVLGLGADGRGTMRIGIVAFSLAISGALVGALWAEIPAIPLAATLMPAWIGLVLLFLNARAKSL